MNKYGYLYLTTEINSDGQELYHFGKKKMGIGFTHDDIRRFKEHHSRGSKASVGVRFDVVIDCDHIGIPCEIVESRTHKYVENFGFDHIDRISHYEAAGGKLISSTEIFSGNSNIEIEDVMKKGEELSPELFIKIVSNLSNVDLFKRKLELHPHQGYDTTVFDDGSFYIGTMDFIKKRLFDNLSRQILLNHKPRSGKTFIIYGYMIEYKPKNVLVLTNYPVLNNQWINEAQQIRDLNYNFINASQNEINESIINNDNPNFVIISLQDGKGGEEIFGKKKFDPIRNIKWDLLVIDECHKGIITKKSEILLSKIHFDRMIGLSATPTKHLIIGTFSKEDIHTYNIVDEKKFKLKFPDIYKLPDISYCIYNPPQNIKNELKYYKDEDQFNWNKFLRVENGRLVYKNDIRIFFMWIAGYYGAINAPLRKFDANSVLLFVQNTECQELLIELLNDIPFYKENYNLHYTNSNINTGSQLYKKTKEDYIPKDGKKCLVIANLQLTTGITLKYCDMVMFMNEWCSIDEYIQASFRCQSAFKGKETCQVIDFTPYRTFITLGRYIENNTLYNGKSLDINRIEFFNSASLFESCDNGFKNIDVNEFKERYVESLDISDKKFFGSYLIDKETVSKDCLWLYEKLGHIEYGLENNIVKDVLDDDNDIEKGKTKKTLSEKKDKEEDNDTNKKLQWALEHIEYFRGKMFLMLVYGGFFKKDNIDDCLDYIHKDKELEDAFVSALSLDGKLNIDFSITDTIYRNYFNIDISNDRLLTMNTKVRKLIYNEKISIFEKLINLLKVLDLIDSYAGISKIEKDLHGEVQTSRSMVDDILSLLPSDFWKNMNNRVLDMANGSGIFPVVMMIKFMDGLKDVLPDEENRFKHIVENMIHVCELQPKNMFIYINLIDLINPGHKYDLKYHRGSFLVEGFDNKMKEWMKKGNFEIFNLGTTNPPYTQMIDMDFLSKSYDICEKVLFVHPSTWLLDEKNKQKKFTKVKDKIGKDLEKIVLFNGNEIFKIALFVPCVYTYINKDKKSDKIECVDRLLNKTVYYDNIYDINKFSDVDIYPKLKEKILDISKVDNIWKYYKDNNRNNIKDWMVTFTGIRGNVSLNNDIYLVKNDFYTIVSNERVPQRNDAKVGNAFLKFYFDTEMECNNFLNYLKTNFSRFCLSAYKNNQNLHRGELEIIPWLDFKEEWNDEKLIKEFCISKEEVEFIDNIIPKYYD